MTTTYETKQRAYVGKFALATIDGKLIHGGGIDAPRPRLYDTEQAAMQAARSIRWTVCHAVKLV